MIKKIILCLLILLFSSAVLAYDIEDWKRLPNDNPEYVQYYENTITIKVIIVGSIETLHSEWFKLHGTVLDEKHFCLSVAGGGTIPEIWIQAKVVDGEVWFETVCFGHEVIHILRTEGLDAVNPDRQMDL